MVVFLLSFFSSRNSIPVLMAILLWLSVHEDLGNGCIFAQFLFFEELHSSLDGHISLISVTCPSEPNPDTETESINEEGIIRVELVPLEVAFVDQFNIELASHVRAPVERNLLHHNGAQLPVIVSSSHGCSLL